MVLQARARRSRRGVFGLPAGAVVDAVCVGTEESAQLHAIAKATVICVREQVWPSNGSLLWQYAL